MHKNISGFTFIELVVATTILIILTTLGFYSYSQSLLDARDSERKSDLATLSSGLKLFKQKRGSYPTPGENFILTLNGLPVALHGKLNNSVVLSTIDKLPLDPLVNVPYIYSITTNKQEYQLGTTLENNENNIAYLEGTYTSVSRDNLPTIILATASTTPVEVSNTLIKNTFVFHNQSKNLPYDLENGAPFADGSSFDTLLNDGGIDLWQNSDYRSCSEVYEAGKSIGAGVYQILNASGTLADKICSVNASGTLSD